MVLEDSMYDYMKHIDRPIVHVYHNLKTVSFSYHNPACYM